MMALQGLCRVLSTANIPMGFIKASSVRPYSMYQPFVKEPIIQPKALDELFQTDEAKHLQAIPVKAARNDMNASIFYDETVNHFINMVMKKGRKALARHLVESSFTKVKQIQLTKYYKAETDAERAEIELNPITIFHKAIANCTPILKLTPIKRGGTTYQVPIAVRPKYARFMAMKWMIDESNDKERTVHLPERLASEFLDAANNTGRVVKRKQDLHRQCEANRAYAHYRWG